MTRPLLLSLGTFLLVAGCGPSPSAPDASAPDEATPAFDRASHPDGEHGRLDDRRLAVQAAAVRRVTAPFTSFERAQRAGYTVKVTGCFENQPVGGMGYHFAKAEFLDDRIDPLKPEVLLYEPIGGGRVTLVGVEYIVPYAAWTRSEPPRQFGVAYARNDTFQVWALHFWVWKSNPRGIVMDWNPRVSCERDHPPLP